MTKKVVALLPMKAHSERVPNKNFKDFNGKPLFFWILNTLVGLDFVDLVVINTDAGEILEKFDIVRTSKVLLRDRKQDLCGDLVSMNLIIEDDIKAIPADCYLMTHVTNPLLSEKTIRSAYELFGARTDGIDSLFTVNRHQTRFYRENGTAINHDPNNLVRTQDLEPWFEENSNLYIFTGESFRDTQARIGLKPLLFETPPLESIDIDTNDEWILAEALAMYRNLKDAGV